MNMKASLIISIPACMLFVTGTWIISDPAGPSDPPALATLGVQADEYNVFAVSNTPKMWASIHKLYLGETFQLHFSVPNALYLGVLDPNGHFFYLVFPGDPAMEKLTPLVESKRFIALKTLNINTDSLKADPYTYGVYTNQPVFTTTGNYTFITGENLHVDDPGYLDKVVIRYVRAKRPVQVLVTN